MFDFEGPRHVVKDVETQFLVVFARELVGAMARQDAEAARDFVARLVSRANAIEIGARRDYDALVRQLTVRAFERLGEEAAP